MPSERPSIASGRIGVGGGAEPEVLRTRGKRGIRGIYCSDSERKFARVGVLELQSASRPTQIRIQDAVSRCERAIEEDVFDPHVIVEVLEVPEALEGAGRVYVQGWRAVCRERDRSRF